MFLIKLIYVIIIKFKFQVHKHKLKLKKNSYDNIMYYYIEYKCVYNENTMIIQHLYNNLF